MNDKICKISLFSFILAVVAAIPVDAAVKVQNSKRSYADAYQQVNALRYQQEYAETVQQTPATLPITVDDEKLAESILNNESTVNVSELEACSMIYPNGVFKWAIPESGVRQNKTPQCVAVVELRDANTGAVLATTTVAAGDTMKCNIDYFPSSGLNMAALSRVELPADVAPTEEDVKQAMNQEQKQNAGLKIAAGAIIAGAAGNLLGPKEAGDTKLFGIGKKRLIDTAIGATAGAGIMAASSYSGKVAGDTIKSTAVNATSGMIIGNMLAGASGGDSVLAKTICTITEGEAKGEHDCIIGNVREISGEITPTNRDFYIVQAKPGLPVKKCSANEKEGFTCSDSNEHLTNIVVEINGKKREIDRGNYKSEASSATKCYYQSDAEDPQSFKETNVCKEGAYFKIESANETTNSRYAYAVFANGTLNKPLGYKYEDWTGLKGRAKLYYRNSDGSVGKLIEGTDKVEFTPSMRDAESGGLIDLSNQARIKGTAVGTVAGGALGGFAGYQGAVNEVSERWLAALREYEGSLTNFVCMTGGRFLSQYNSYVEIAEPLKSEQ